MISKDDFQHQYERLADAFGSPRKKDRALIYYEMIDQQDINHDQLKHIANYIIRHHDKFPTINTLLQVAHSLYPPPSTFNELPTEQKIQAKWLKSSPKEFQQKLISFLTTTPNPETFCKGFRFSQGIIKKWAPMKWKITVETLKELLGEKRYHQIMNQKTDMIEDLNSVI